MLQAVIVLEQLRQKVEQVEYQIGSLSDYLDRGKPNESQQQQAIMQIAAYQEQSAALRAQLHERFVVARAEQPHAIEQWVQWHRDICQRILAETGSQAQRGVRQWVARETLRAWDNVARGEQEVVLINPSFLEDYRGEVARAIRSQQQKWWKRILKVT